ncbi:MAG: ATP-binding protein [Thermomicrobiales bacterium]
MVAANDTRTRQPHAAFGHLLKRLRTAADLTQEELAERASVSARLISDLERGTIHRPRRDTVRLLADGLRLSGADRDAFSTMARGRPEAGAMLTAVAATAPRSLLPTPPTQIVGRLKETAAATALLIRPETRLLTLIGPGGVGKTRLAIEVASRAAVAFPDGVSFVDLAPIRDPALVVSAIARAREVQSDGDQTLRDQLIASLASCRALIVLDNVEHLAAAATDIADLLAACQGLTFLTTSRAPLHIRAEQEYHVEPLVTPRLDSLPPTSELAQIPAVDLFLRRAEAANRSFAMTEGNAPIVAEIAVRLDGLPLAIELAAARVKILPPSALLARLEHRLPLLTGGARDLPARLQALRTTIDWSYDLLSPEEQRLFRRLSVFAWGCSLDAAEAVGSSASSSLDSILDLLTALVDKSLLRIADGEADGPRFGMLETIREYGREALAAAGEEEDARCLHAAWYLAFAGQAETELSGPAQELWYARLEAEHDNLRAALGWAIDGGDAAIAMRLGSCLWRFWDTRGYYVEGRAWLERALSLSGDVEPGTKARAAGGAGVMASRQGNHEQAAAHFLQAQALYREAGDQSGLAGSLNDLAIVLCALDEYDRARTLHEEALALYRALGHQVQIARVLGNLGMLAQDLKEYDRAAELHAESLAIRRAVGDLNGVAGALVGLALVANAQGRHDEAAELQKEALELFRSLGNQVFIAEGFEYLAIFAEAQRRPERALRLFGAAESLRGRIGAPLPPYRQELCERSIAGARAQFADAEPAGAWRSGLSMPLDEAIAYALHEAAV